MATRQVMRHCQYCGRPTLHVQQYLSAATHIVLLLVTAGLWVIVLLLYYLLAGWLIEPVRKMMDRGRCTVCGSKAIKESDLSARPSLVTPPTSPTPVTANPPQTVTTSAAATSIPAAHWKFFGGLMLLVIASGAIEYLARPREAPAPSLSPSASTLVAEPAPNEADISWESVVAVGDSNDLARLCRAGVSAIMGRPVDGITVDRTGASEADVRYVRSTDQTVWRFRCKFEAGELVWRTIDAFGPGSGLGRWRNGPDDSRVTLATRDGVVRVTEVFSDGSSVQTDVHP